MADDCYLEFLKSWNVIRQWGQEGHDQSCKFKQKLVATAVIWQFLKIATCCQLGFLNSRNLNGRQCPKGWDTSPCKIFSKSIKQLLRYCDFLTFQEGGWPTSWICKFWKFLRPTRCRGARCINMPNFIKTGQMVAEILRFIYFSRWRQSAILHVFYISGSPMKYIWWSVLVCKIWLECMQ